MNNAALMTKEVKWPQNFSEKKSEPLSHPDPCYVITNDVGTAIVANLDRKILIFTNKDDAEQCVRDNEEAACLKSDIHPNKSIKWIVKLVTWENVLGVCGKKFKEALLDKKGPEKFCRTISLSKDI